MLKRKNEEDQQPRILVEDIVPAMKYEGPHRKSLDVALYYGFHLVPPLKIDKEDRAIVDNKPFPVERIALMRYYLEQGLDACKQPVQLAYTSKVPYKPEVHLHLEVVGSKLSTAETLLIHSAMAILKELGFDELSVTLNSVGGKESFEPFQKEATEFYRKHLNSMHDDCRELFKDDFLGPMRCEKDECVQLRQEAPQPIAFLTERSRRHFSEVLEFLEEFEIPYTIDPYLLGDKDFISRTLFQISTRNAKGDEYTLAHGERYDHMAKKAGFSRHIPSAGICLEVSGQRAPQKIDENYQEYKIQPSKNPVAYIVQIGMPARRKSLDITEHLRQAKIPIHFSYAEGSLKEQLHQADELGVPVILIVGQKEVLEDTVLIRDQKTRSQVAVPQAELVTHLKKFM